MEYQNHSDTIHEPEALTRQQLLERQLSDVQHVAQVGVWEFKVDLNKLIWSDETCRIIGVDKQSFDGAVDTYLSAVHPEDRHKVATAIRQVKAEPIYPALEHRVIRPGGEVRHLLVRGYPFIDEQGAASVSGTVHDITDAKQSSAALRAMSGKLFNALESMTDAFCMLGKDWRITYMNKEAERLLQRPRGELLGKLVWNEFRELAGSRFEHELRQAMAQNQPAAFEEFYSPLKLWKELRVFPSEEGLAVYFTDISERKRLQEIERRNEERFKVVARATTDVIWDWDVKTNHIWWNEGTQSVLGYCLDDFEEGIQAWSKRIHPDEQSRVAERLYAAIEQRQESWSDEYRFMRKDGLYTDVRTHGIFIRDCYGDVSHMIGLILDISEHKRAELDRQETEARNRIHASLLDKAQDAISVTGMDARISFWNKGAERLYGWTSEEIIGKTKGEFLIANHEEFDKACHEVERQGDWTGELHKRRKDGGTITVESHLTLVRDDSGNPQSVLEIETDITKRKEATQAIENLAFFDPLTRLPNRRLLLDRLQHALAMSRRNQHMGALLFIDLDNFKTLNDTFGHDKGDLLLQKVARRLEASVPRKSDTVARFGGDEFVVLLEDLSMNSDEAASQAETLSEKILTVFARPFRLEGHEHHTTPSIGVALFDQKIGNIDELLKRADLAMYQAKSAGRNTIRFFDPDMQNIVNARVELESDLRHGLQHREFTVHYQRQTDGSGNTIGAEALVRWHHPRRGWVAPAQFIPLTEETGLIVQLGQWVLETACTQLAIWAKDPQMSSLTIAVNIGARQFRHPDFVNQVLDVLDRTGANPNRLKLELTESLLESNVENLTGKMHALKAKGIAFALDDFGTGYSSISYLKSLPLDQLKIDRSFVRDVLIDANDAAVACTIMALGHTLGLDVIAEGVETEPQRDFLARNGCQAFQGYLFSRPIPAEQFREPAC